MAKHSAGILPYRHKEGRLEVMLVHPGGPFWAKKDAGSWSVPKGLIEAGEDPLRAAGREFAEETGSKRMGIFWRWARSSSAAEKPSPLLRLRGIGTRQRP